MNQLEVILSLFVLGAGLLGIGFVFIKAITSMVLDSHKGEIFSRKMKEAVRNAPLMKSPRGTVVAASSNGGNDPCKDPFTSSNIEKYKNLKDPEQFFVAERRATT